MRRSQRTCSRTTSRHKQWPFIMFANLRSGVSVRLKTGSNVNFVHRLIIPIYAYLYNVCLELCALRRLYRVLFLIDHITPLSPPHSIFRILIVLRNSCGIGYGHRCHISNSVDRHPTRSRCMLHHNEKHTECFSREFQPFLVGCAATTHTLPSIECCVSCNFTMFPVMQISVAPRVKVTILPARAKDRFTIASVLSRL